MFRLLLVEDNPADVRLWREALAEAGAPVQFHAVSDGTDALAHLAQCSGTGSPLPDLILLDLNLPRMCGHEVLAAIRASAVWRRLPVLVLSASQDPKDVERAYAGHANGYLLKPHTFEAFVEMAGQVVRHWAGVVKLPRVA